ncbi:MAG: sensor histidine kinase [Muribaculaceae bacterium]
MGLKRTINYQTRIFFVISVFTWIITLAFFTVQYTREREYKVDLLNARLQEINARIISDVDNGVELNDEYVKKLSGNDSLRVSVIDKSGVVVFDTNDKGKNLNHANRQEVKDALAYGKGYTIRRQSETNSCEYFYSATLAHNMVVRTALPYNNALLSELNINSIYGYIIVVVMLILTLLAFFAARRISQNVESLRDFANCAEHGDIGSFSTASFPKDELGEISGHIINMYKNLKHTAEERDRHMREAMFEESEKNRIKQQLTNNINHELKTPVHAIQACLETLITNGDKLGDEARQGLVDKSYQNVKRLSALLADVSMLTRLTDAPDKIIMEMVNIKELLNYVAEDLQALYPQDRFMRFHINVGADVNVCGNIALLESIFKNLMVNSIIHSGGTDLYLDCCKDRDNYYHFTYFDNGKGVPKEHLDHIFERFYRIDKGRSRANGGTGLGLSIVKNAILFHKGKITATNRVQGGLQFNFTLRE